MPNEEALGPRKTMFVFVIVVGCFAVLWPKMLSPLILGTSREQLKPNQYDRDAGCCEVIFETEVAILELLNEVCSSAIQSDGKISPYDAAECRKAVNDTCGLDIQAFLKRSDNVGKTTKVLLDTMKASNSSCLKEHFGVPVWSISIHPAFNSWVQEDTVKQERPLMRGATPHPALRERGRAIPPGAPAPPPRRTQLPAHVRPPPIPGMRPPLGSAGGPVAAPKSSMGFVMPVYTICIIIFFVYTLSKILFKRTGSTAYDELSPDPQFRRRVFRGDSRSSPETLVVTAISGLVDEVRQQMEASYGQDQQRQELQASQPRAYTNGTVIHTGPVQIVASEYREPAETAPNEKEPSPELLEPRETTPELLEPRETTPELLEPRETTPELIDLTPEPQESIPELLEPKEESEADKRSQKEIKRAKDRQMKIDDLKALRDDINRFGETLVSVTDNVLNAERYMELMRADAEQNREGAGEGEAGEGIEAEAVETEVKKSTSELLEEALKEDSPSLEEGAQENASVKVLGMELRAHAADGGAWRDGPPPPPAPAPHAPLRPPHEAEQVQSIFLETEIPQQSRVLVADFADRTDQRAAKHAPMVVSGKMTLSLIQDAPRDTPDRDLESTLDDFTTASGVTQPAAEKEDDLSDEEIDEEIEVEEIEEEVEVEEMEVEEVEVEEVEEEEVEPKEQDKKQNK